MNIRVELCERGLLIRSDYNKNKLMRHMAGTFDKSSGGWVLPARLDVLGKLDQLGVEATAEVSQLRQQLEIQQQELNNAKLDGHTTAQDMPIKTKPFQHQEVAYQVATTLPAAALLMEQGTGKTLTAIAVAGHRFLHHGVRYLLVVCPASVVPVWPREFAEHANYRHRVVPLIADSAVKKIQLVAGTMAEAQPDELTVIVVNFESAWRIESVLERVVRKDAMIVVDESQRIKTPGTEQSKCLHRLGKHAKYRMILSGTPITQNPLDLYSQYKFLEPSMFGASFTVFRNRYAVMGGFEGRQVVEYQRLDELMARAHSIAYRITKAEALDLPSEMVQIRPVILPAKVQKMYRELKQHSITELEKESENGKIVAANVLTKLLRLQQMAGGWVNTDENGLVQVHQEKLDALKCEIETILEDESRKVVIFARFLPEINAITTMLSKMKLDHRWITGAVGQAERGEAVDDFQKDADVRVFTAQIATAGLGITLTAADTAIFFSMDFSLANHEQAKARVHRIGQKMPVTYMYLLASGTVDEKIFDALKSKKSVADMVVDDWRSVI